MIRLYWPDGTVLAGKDADDVLARLGRLQWTPLDVETMKARLADRVLALFGIEVDPALPSDEFLTAIDAAALCAVDYSGDPAKPSVWRPMEGRPLPLDPT